jgi:hypothetical protein
MAVENHKDVAGTCINRSLWRRYPSGRQTIRIDQAGLAAPATPSRPRRSQSGFALPPAAPSPEELSAPPAELAPLPPMAELADGLATVVPELADQAAGHHGRALLKALAGLQAATLGGEPGSARDALAELVLGLPEAADVGLNEVLKAIAQRAPVELARFG